MSDSLANLFITITGDSAPIVAAFDKIAASGDAMAAKVEAAAAKVEAAFAQMSAAAERSATTVSAAATEESTAVARVGAATTAAATETESAQAKVGVAAEGTATKVSTASAKQAAAAETAAAKTKVATAEQATAFETMSAKAAAAEKTVLDTSLTTSSGLQAAFSKSGLAFAGVAAVIGYETVKMAATFDQKMELIATQAHAPQAEVDNLKQKVLELAGQTGQSADSLAEALYHIESTGTRGQAAIDGLAASAKVASIGMASLDDVSYAMSGMMSAGMKDVTSYSDGVALLNTIVGQGDMTMQGLSKAIGTGVLPAFKDAGLGAKDFGAALATLTDNSVPPEVAANHLKTSVQLLQNQSGPAKKALSELGIGAGQLGKDLDQGGLQQALVDLQSHMENFVPAGGKVKLSLSEIKKDSKDFYDSLIADGATTDEAKKATDRYTDGLNKNGSAAVQAGALLSKAFGGARSASTMETLIGEAQRFNTKLGTMGDAASRAKQLQDDWNNTQDQFNVKMAKARDGLEAVGIQIGNVLLPVVGDAAQKFADFTQWLQQHQGVATTLAYVIGTVLTVAVGALTLKLIAAVLGPTASLLKGGIAVGKWALDMVLKFTGVTRAAELSASQRELADRNAAAAAEEAATQETTAAERAATAMQEAATQMSEAADRISVAFEGTVVKAQAAAKEIEVAEQELITETATKTADLEAQMGKRKLAYDGVVRSAQTSATEVEAADRRAVAAIESEAAQTEAAAARIKVAYEEVGVQAGLSRDKVVIADREASAANDAEAVSARGAGAAKGRGGVGGAVGGLLLGGMAASAIDSAMPTDPVSKSISMSSGPVAANHAFGQLTTGDFSGFWNDLVNLANGNTAKAAAVAIQNAKKMKDGTSTQLDGLVKDAATKTAAWAKNIADKTADGARAGINNVGLFKNGTTAGLTTAVSDAASKAAQWAKTIADQTASAAAKSKSSVDGMRVGTGAALGGLVADTVGHMTGFSGAVDAKTSLARQLAKDRTAGMRSDVGGGLAATVGDAIGHMTSFTGAIGTGMNNSTQKTGQFPGDARRSLGDTGSILYAAGQAVMQGLLNGLKSLWGNITSFVGGIAGWIASHKGPLEYDRQLLVPHGNAIMAGLHDGLTQGNDRVRALVSSIAGDIADTINASPAAKLVFGASVMGGDGASLAVGSGVPGLASALNGGGQAAGTTVVQHFHIAGSIWAEQELGKIVREQNLQFGIRNTGNGLTYTGFGA